MFLLNEELLHMRYGREISLMLAKIFPLDFLHQLCFSALTWLGSGGTSGL